MGTASDRQVPPPLPQPDDLTTFFWEGAQRHELWLQRCTRCGHYQHRPRSVCKQHEYGATPEQFGSFVLAQRDYAAQNPDAIFRERLTMEDYLASRYINEPLHLLDCPTNTDGGACNVGRRHGANFYIEVTRQLSGECGDRQIDGAQVGVVSNSVGGFAGCALLAAAWSTAAAIPGEPTREDAASPQEHRAAHEATRGPRERARITRRLTGPRTRARFGRDD